jgi:hypothetical protein
MMSVVFIGVGRTETPVSGGVRLIPLPFVTTRLHGGAALKGDALVFDGLLYSLPTLAQLTGFVKLFIAKSETISVLG